MTPEQIAAIRDDIAKYPNPHRGSKHDPVVYTRALLAHIDTLTEAVEALPFVPDEDTEGWEWVSRSDVLAILRGEQ